MKTRAVFAVVIGVAMLLSPRNASAVAQRTGDFELEIDAPWRMEPRGPNRVYGAIPIQVSIHDADQPLWPQEMLLQQIINVTQAGNSKMAAVFTFLAGPIADVIEGLDALLEQVFGVEVFPFDAFPRVSMLNQFQALRVYEEVNGQFVLRATYTLANIHEVERTVGLWQQADNQYGAESPYAPPARPIWSLCRRWQGQSCAGFAPLRPTSEWNLTAMYSPAVTTPGADVRLRAELVVSTTEDGDPYTRTFRRTLSVHLGELSLPKFDAGWAYGDLHYHSQGTDNDGESGYSYRGTLHAMGALGLDFAFATDHASNSDQIGSAAPIPTAELVMPISRGLRDLSPDRFANNIDLLNGPAGANRQITSHARSAGVAGELVAPQLFLGSEVDVIPEDKPGVSNIIACRDAPGMLKAIDQEDPWPDDYWCGTMTSPTLPDGRVLFYDVQGPDGGDFLSTRLFGRQHLLHLPVDPQRKTAFIPSNTSKYGGATRRLGEILNVELGQRQKGYIFLAHPFARATGDDLGRVGPDLLPYSAVQLEDAFKSPHYLGLQIWNENSLFSASANDRSPFVAPNWTDQHQPRHDYDFQMFDVQLLYGLDKTRTDALSWLPANQPRRLFAAAGSDAHGDWNYRREGYFFGTDEVNSTAMGSPRNLVFVGAPAGAAISGSGGTGRPVSQGQVIDGLRSGNFALTDGPAVRMVIDVNGNGTIDPNDTPMGGVRQHTNNAPFSLIVEWLSTAEFGPVKSVDLMLGVWAQGHVDGMVYTRAYQGPANVPANEKWMFTDPSTGKRYMKSVNFPYWFDPNPGDVLAITPFAWEGYSGRRVITIDPALYPVGDNVCVLSEPAKRTTTTTSRTAMLGAATFTTTTTATAATSSTSGGGNTGTLPDGTVVYLKKSLEVLLDDLQNGIVDPPPACIRRDFANAKRPDRMFARAHVRNDLAPDSNLFCSYAPLYDEPQCVYRQAFSNPVWVNVVPCTSPIACNSSVGQLPTEATTTDGGTGGGSTGPIGGTYQPPVTGGVITTSPVSPPPPTGRSSMLLMQPAATLSFSR